LSFFHYTTFFFFMVLGFWTQGLTLVARQVCYHLSYVPSPFYFIFWIGSRIMPRLPWTVILLFMLREQLGWQASTTTASFYWLRWCLSKFLPPLASNHNPFPLCPCAWLHYTIFTCQFSGYTGFCLIHTNEIILVWGRVWQTKPQFCV
jgi:hypothetical protein